MSTQPSRRRAPVIACVAAILAAGSAIAQERIEQAGPPPTPAIADSAVSITLVQAQDQATRAKSSMARIGQFGVEAAKQHRLAAQSDYFPKISSAAWNLHFNKFMGQEIQVTRPILGTTLTAGLPLLGKDLTFVTATVLQPITPLFKVHQAVNIARADERIARAKAGMTMAGLSTTVEKTYFDLLIALRQAAIAESTLKKLRSGRMIAGATPVVANMEKFQTESVAAARDLTDASTRVKELTASLNQLMGWAPETELDLEMPAPLTENLTLHEVSDQAVATSAEVLEAQETIEKARAAVKLSKLDYVPDVAAVWGYAYNGDAIPLLPRDFSFVGVMASWNVFDFGKREHAIKERKAQLGMAEAALQLAKIKASAGIKQSFFELVRSRQLCEIAQQAQSVVHTISVKYSVDDPDVKASSARLDIQMLQAELEHRQAYAKVKSQIGD